MDVWDWVLLGIGSFVAVMALVRLMLRRQNQLLAELNMQIESEERRAKQEALAQPQTPTEQDTASN